MNSATADTCTTLALLHLASQPVLVCNRTGRNVLDFTAAQSVAAVDGTIAFAPGAPDWTVVLVHGTPRARCVTNWRRA